MDFTLPIYQFFYTSFLIFINLAMIGQDIVVFYGISHEGSLFFTTNFYQVSLPAYKFLFVPQAWTLGVELTFYLIAPFLVKFKTRYLVMLLGLSLALRIFFYTQIGLSKDPWNYRFFPFELAFFIAGILSFRFYLRLKETSNNFDYLNKIACLLFFFIISFNFIPASYYIKMIIFYITVCLTLPSLFNQSYNSNIDKKIGAFSYPIYIGHHLVITLLGTLSNILRLPVQTISPSSFGLLSITLSILFAAMLIHFIETPIDKLRYRTANVLSKKISLQLNSLLQTHIKK